MMMNTKIPSLNKHSATVRASSLWLLGLLLFLVAGNSHSATDKLLVVGDSLSAAYGMPTEAGWVAAMQRRIDGTRYELEVVNASVSGDTTANGLTKMEDLIADYEPRFVIIELGGNDGLRGLSLKTMAENLTSMSEQAKAAGATVIIVGMQIPSNYGRAYTTLFTNTFAKVATDADALLVPFLLAGLESGLDWFQRDGVHPNEKAQPILLDNVWAILEPVFEETY